MAAPKRQRRRVFRVSEAAEYDRTADRPDFVSAFNDDGERAVVLDEEAEDTLQGDAFLKEQVPPHHGGH